MTERAGWPDRARLPIEPYQVVGKIDRAFAGSDPIGSPEQISAQHHTVLLDFRYDGGAPGSGVDETLDVGEDSGTPVVRDYDVPFRFTGTLHKVVIDIVPA